MFGFASYLIPGVGEVGDFAWAPFQAFLLMELFGAYSVASFGFLEEMLPGLDFIPTATLAWSIQNVSLLKPLKAMLFPREHVA